MVRFGFLSMRCSRMGKMLAVRCLSVVADCRTSGRISVSARFAFGSTPAEKADISEARSKCSRFPEEVRTYDSKTSPAFTTVFRGQPGMGHVDRGQLRPGSVAESHTVDDE